MPYNAVHASLRIRQANNNKIYVYDIITVKKETYSMQLLIKQRVFSWADTYDIYDEYGNQNILSKMNSFHWDIVCMCMI